MCEDRDYFKLAHTELVRRAFPKWIESSKINGMSIVLMSTGLQVTFGHHRRHGTFLSRMVRRRSLPPTDQFQDLAPPVEEDSLQDLSSALPSRHRPTTLLWELQGLDSC